MRVGHKLTAQQERFCQEYLIDLNAGAAAMRAGYAPANHHVRGYQLLQNPLVSERVQELKGGRAKRTAIDADVVLVEWLRLASVDPTEAFNADGSLKPLHEIPEDVRKAISGIEIDELFEGRGEDRMQVGYVKKLKFWDKNRALEMLGKHLGILTDRVALQNPDGSAVQFSFNLDRASGDSET